jgi:type 1 fimbria pilin
MKKILVTFLAMLMCVSMFAFTACKDDDGHTHSYGSWSITSNATCTTDGSRSKSCSCGDVITETIPATGHNMVGGVCTECGATE